MDTKTLAKITLLILCLYASFTVKAQLPNHGFTIDSYTEIVVIDPQNDLYVKTMLHGTQPKKMLKKTKP